MSARKKRAPKKASPRRIGRTSAVPSDIADEPFARRPGHILVLAETEDESMRMLRARIGEFSTRAIRGRSTLALHRTGDDRPRLRYFPSLGVVAAELTPREMAECEGRPDVRVFPNEERSLPHDPETGGARMLSRVGGPVQPRGGHAPVQPSALAASPMGAYGAGFRDGVIQLAAALGSMGAGSPTAEASPAVRVPLSGTATTYELSLIGVGPSTTVTGRGIRVAVLDTGIDADHLDFAGRTNTANLRSFVHGVASAHDGHGHGTHVAGTLAGPARVAPRYGVAPDVELFVAKVLDDQGFGSDHQILDAMEWVIGQGVRVINLSLGSERRATTPYSEAYEIVARRLLQRANGTLLVAAAGNESTRHCDVISPVGNPAACPSIMGIAAVDSNGVVADFSCGQVDPIGTVDVAAPGVGIHSARAGGGYAVMSGTSMATPHVSGVAALYLEAEPDLSPLQLWRRIQRRAQLLRQPDEDVGSGLVQA